MLIGKFLYEILTSKLGLSVCGIRTYRIELGKRSVTCSAEYIIGRYMDEFCIVLSCSYRKISGSYRIYLICKIDLGLARIHVGMSCAVDYRIGLYLINEFSNFFYIGDIKLSFFLGIFTPVNMIFFLGFCFSMVIIFTLTVTVSRMSERIRKMAQQVAIQEETIKRLEAVTKADSEDNNERDK